jgi:hypothetical protein
MGAGASIDVNPSVASGVLPGKPSASATELKAAICHQVGIRALDMASARQGSWPPPYAARSQQVDDLLARMPQNADGTYNLEAFKQALHSPPAPTAAAGGCLW